MTDCHLCQMRENLDCLKAEREAELLELGGVYSDDILSPLPLNITFYSRPTSGQWRRLLELMIEVEGNPRETTPHTGKEA